MINTEELKTFLQKIEEAFPYNTMASNFKGHHHFILQDNKLVLGVWYKGKAWHAVFTDDEPVSSTEVFIEEIKRMIGEYKKEQSEN